MKLPLVPSTNDLVGTNESSLYTFSIFAAVTSATTAVNDFSVTVHRNQRPTYEDKPSGLSVLAYHSLSFTVNGSDDESDTITWTAGAKPTWADLTGSLVTLTPSNADLDGTGTGTETASAIIKYSDDYNTVSTSPKELFSFQVKYNNVPTITLGL
jgi:hypothetical protein